MNLVIFHRSYRAKPSLTQIVHVRPRWGPRCFHCDCSQLCDRHPFEVSRYWYYLKKIGHSIRDKGHKPTFIYVPYVSAFSLVSLTFFSELTCVSRLSSTSIVILQNFRVTDTTWKQLDILLETTNTNLSLYMCRTYWLHRSSLYFERERNRIRGPCVMQPRLCPALIGSSCLERYWLLVKKLRLQRNKI